MSKVIDFNCDMGEGFGLWQFGNDEGMLDYITSANLACGYHAGDPNIMKKMVDLCKEKNVAVGAHVGLPDLMGFGRRKIDVTPSELKNYIIYQTGALQAFLRIAGVEMQHMKLHGALFTMTAESRELSRAALEATAEIDENLMFYTTENTITYDIAKEMGFNIVREFYADRGCQSNGVLVFNYSLEDIGGSVEAAANRVVRVLEENKVTAVDGKEIDFECESFCVHSDTENALKLSEKITKTITERGWSLEAVGK